MPLLNCKIKPLLLPYLELELFKLEKLKPRFMKKYLFLLILTCMALNTAFAQMSTRVKNNSVSQNQKRSQLKLAYFRGQRGDLPSIRVVDLSNGAVFTVYYDAVSKQVTEESIPILSAFYKEIADLTAVDAGKVGWASVVFTKDKKYTPPRGGSSDERWAVLVDETGKLGEQGINELYRIIPHEQTHYLERTFIPSSPRWFAEGLATWVGLKITERSKPELARTERAKNKAERAKINAPLKLAGWGSLVIKKEAIWRQVTPEVRARMEKDPTYSPPGNFSFEQNDFVNDESNTPARYAASLELFEELEKRAGRKRLQSWLRSVWQQGTALETKKLTAQINEQLNVDVTEWVK